MTISKAESDALLQDAIMLGCLERAGVGNWGDYDFAGKILKNSVEQWTGQIRWICDKNVV